MNILLKILPALAVTAACPPVARAGSFSAARADAGNAFDAAVPGFVGPHGPGMARVMTGISTSGEPVFANPGNYLNPLFFGWADQVESYLPSDGGTFIDPELALGPVTGDNFDVVSLGDQTAAQITAKLPPGAITVRLARPVKNLSGADFVVYENAIAGSGGSIFADLAYVEVSADGVTFSRFPATSLTAAAVGAYGTLHPTDVHNLAGKHLNAYGECWGTPFDLDQVGLAEIRYVRLVDVPGTGAYKDAAGRPIYDPWRTYGSGGFDLEAVGVISTAMTFPAWPPLLELPANQRGPRADPDGDGLPNLLEYAFGKSPWLADAGPVARLDADGTFRFPRDERTSDLVCEVQVSNSLAAAGWTTLATSTAGGPFIATPGADLAITDEAAPGPASVGVLRTVGIREKSPPAGTARFYRVVIRR